jgi:hypothetical protein
MWSIVMSEDGTVVAYGFPPEVTPSDALHEIADAFAQFPDEQMTAAEHRLLAATLRDIAMRVSQNELRLGIIRGQVIYDAANQSEPPIFGQSEHGGIQ